MENLGMENLGMDNSQPIEASSAIDTDAPITPQDLAEAITELQAYRDRLFEETTAAAKKAKLTKTATMARLEPELAPIDAMLEKLRTQHAAMLAEN